MRVSRATFLQAFGTVLLGACVDTRGVVGMAEVRSNRSEASRLGGRFRVQDATAALFFQHLNTTFAVRFADGTRARLVLAEVVERPVTKDVEQFSLIFHAPADTPVRDGTHAFQHPALGDFNLFIVSVGSSKPRRTVYQACFSRHLSAREVPRRDVFQISRAVSRT